ncbi:cation:dicarboxylate symporter family transporter [Aneurinibacillus aneurinilyticus]|jgi:proton glutamate symport protein|uniref:Cation:dicarboxylase symporter family transporter n=2 Tax=Aneurinibacillus aneurinilyticus TaxID=1391 RepID=A0A848CXU9_ANEAE|nr:cation:dicarboxylase symporter family transporter [Aneurinibacillus aneurinilyticus]ERI08963.1 proton/sodium-glutamate symport protein GltT [Aneurinibacillus aneurinilyticus ATCC 12856]MCI1695515.1 cation:dicarboxylase symporter family transporter [Aneurinibacillus aneurinilyticus]MED0672890.1 cation:dicarboxylase symporter family transporter [Aneurinibacillus aneurinilyticus]MED0708947.1 cation:dicarboxylase symporter family transporter [Aneurinibacillus aneurinilyticus]MED0723778.1 cation
MKKFGLVWQILIGLILGIAVGAIFYGNPKVAEILDPIGQIFLHLIKMIVVPIILSTLIVGVAGVGGGKSLGRLGGKTIIYFEIVTTVAIIIGLLVANVFQPGVGIDMSQLSQTDISKYVHTTEETQAHGFADTLVNIVPTNIVQSMAKGDNLAIIFFAVMFGLALGQIGERGKPLLHFFELVADTMFKLTNMIMKFAPFGVFALIGVTVSKFGLSSLIPLGKLMILVYLTMIFFIVVVLGLISKWAGVNIFRLVATLKEELLLAYSTSSSETVLPRIMEKLEKMGCPKAIVSFVVPTGYSFNLDGSTLYQALAGIFIAQMYGINLSIGQQITFMLVLMLTSKGIAGVPGVSFVVLLATLGSVGIPIEGLAFIAGIDRLLDMARTVVNVVGNSVAAIVMSKWEGQFNKEQAKDYLKNLGRPVESN